MVLNAPVGRLLTLLFRWLSFEYLTPRIRITPKDLADPPEFSRPSQLHFICSPQRAADIIGEIKRVDGWKPLTIYEPIPVSVTLPAVQIVVTKYVPLDGRIDAYIRNYLR